MDFTKLSDKINNKDYNSKLPYPSHPANNEYEKALKKEALYNYRVDNNRLYEIFKADLHSYVESELGKTLTDKQWTAIFDKAWEDGHSSGYYDVLYYTSDIVDIVKEFI